MTAPVPPASEVEIEDARLRASRAQTAERMVERGATNALQRLFADGRIAHVHVVAGELVRARIADADRAGEPDASLAPPWRETALRRAADPRLVVEAAAGPVGWTAVQRAVLDDSVGDKLVPSLKAALSAIHGCCRAPCRAGRAAGQARGRVMSAHAKPGPKPLPGVERTASGRPSRSKSAIEQRDRDVVASVLAARGAAARNGLSPKQAAQPEAGSAVGRLYLRGAISRRDFDAALVVSDRLLDARRALGSHVVTNRHEGGTPGGGIVIADEHGITKGYVAWATTAIRRADEMRAAIRGELGDRRAALAWRALETVILDDHDAATMTDNLRAALAAVHNRVINGNRAR